MLALHEFFLFAGDGRTLFNCPEANQQSGSKVFVLGQSLSGKTLFLKTIHGQWTGYSGRLLYNKNQMTGGPEVRRSLFIEHLPLLLENETVSTNLLLSLPGQLTSGQKQKLAEFINLTGLGEYYQTRIKYLSFSQKKFVELIRALLAGPRLLLLDDLNCWFDQRGYITALRLLDTALAAGCLILACGNQVPDEFDQIWRIDQGVMAAI